MLADATMKAIGTFLVMAGIFWGVVSYNKEISYSSYYSDFGDRNVINFELIANRSRDLNISAVLFLGGIFLIGFGFVVSGIYDIKKEETTASDLVKSKEKYFKKCPSCAEIIKIEAVKCRFCGNEFDKNEIKMQVENMKKNIKGDFKRVDCETRNGTGDAFCFSCKKISPIKGMYYNAETGTYYHEDCLPV